jgi:site-specific recombinase XerD
METIQYTFQNKSKHFEYIEGIQDCYTDNAKTFIDYARKNGGLNLKTLKKYFVWLNEQGYAPTTVRTKMLAAIDRMKKIYNLPGVKPRDKGRFDWELLEIRNEIKAPKNIFKRITDEKILSHDGLVKIINGATKIQSAFVEFLYYTGCRVSEMANIRLIDCNTINGITYIRIMGKGKIERKIQIKESHYQKIVSLFRGKTYLFETSTGNKYPRQYISHEVSKSTKKFTGVMLSAHKLRHTFATRMMQKGFDPMAITIYMGNSNVGHTYKIYSHNSLNAMQLFDD